MTRIHRGMKIRTPWNYTRNEYQAMGSLFERNLREQAPEGLLREAEREVSRYSKEQKAEKNEIVRREEKWKETARVLTDTKKPTQKETYSAPKDSRMPHQADAALDSQSKSDVTKLKNICESLKLLERNISDKGLEYDF